MNLEKFENEANVIESIREKMIQPKRIQRFQGTSLSIYN